MCLPLALFMFLAMKQRDSRTMSGVERAEECSVTLYDSMPVQRLNSVL